MKGNPVLEIEISFENQHDNVRLSGTLSIPDPENAHPCVILISGSGPQTRDEDIVGHKIFKDIADYLSSNGIGVLRFDDRGVGKSRGVFGTAGLVDFQNDVIAAFDFVGTHPNIDSGKIGVLGHSVGGLLAPMIACELKHKLAFLVSLAGPAMMGYDLYIKQHELIAEKRGSTRLAIDQSTVSNRKTCDLVLAIEDRKLLMKEIKKLLFQRNGKKTLLAQLYTRIVTEIRFFQNRTALQTFVQPWFKDWLSISPKDYWQKVKCPVLAINGGKDLQVPQENLQMIEEYLRIGGNHSMDTKLFPDMNHLFQKAETGLPEEYASIASSIDREVLETITHWVHKVIRD